MSDAITEVERLQGIKPGLPENIAPMARFGVRWNGPDQPLAVPMSDGYWTPWHVASAEVEQLKKRITGLDCRYTMGDVADISGSHCPIEEPCDRCDAEATTEHAINADIEVERLRAELADAKEAISRTGAVVCKVHRERDDAMRQEAEAWKELAAVNLALSETDECPAGVAGVRHLQGVTEALAVMVANMKATEDGLLTRLAENSALLRDLRAYRDRTEAALVELTRLARVLVGQGVAWPCMLDKLGLARDAKGADRG